MVSECPICYTTLENDINRMFLPCTHSYHIKCLASWIRESKKKVCPICNLSIFRRRKVNPNPMFKSRTRSKSFSVMSKKDRLIEKVRQQRQYPPPPKTPPPSYLTISSTPPQLPQRKYSDPLHGMKLDINAAYEIPELTLDESPPPLPPYNPYEFIGVKNNNVYTINKKQKKPSIPNFQNN